MQPKFILWVAGSERPVAEESGGQAYRYSVFNMMPSFFSLLS
jgi:hypothetical protein